MGRTSDLVDQEMADRQKRIADNTKRLQTDEENRATLDKASKNYNIEPGQYAPTEQDKEDKEWLVSKGTDRKVVDDPYNLRDGKSRDAEFGPDAPTPAQLKAANTPEPVADESAGIDLKRIPLAKKKSMLAKLTNQTPPSDGTGGSGSAAPVPAAPAGPDYLAEADARTRSAQDEMKAAQAQAKAGRDEADWRNDLWRTADLAGGRAPDTAREQARRDEADAPVRDLEQRRKIEGESLRNEGERVQLREASLLDQPNQKATLLARRMGQIGPNEVVTAREWKYIEAGNSADQAKAKAAEERRNHNMEHSDRIRGQDTQLAIAGMRTGKDAAGKPISENSVSALANLRTAAQDLNGLSTGVGGKGALSALWAQVPFGENNAWQAQRSALIDATSAAMAGGKRPSVILLKRIDEAMPQIGDTEELKKQKLAHLQQMVALAHDNLLNSESNSGRNVSAFEKMLGGSPYADADPGVMVDAQGRPHRWNGQTWVPG